MPVAYVRRPSTDGNRGQRLRGWRILTEATVSEGVVRRMAIVVNVHAYGIFQQCRTTPSDMDGVVRRIVFVADGHVNKVLGRVHSLFGQ